MEKNEPYKFFKEIINIDIDEIMDKWYNLDKHENFYELYKHFLLIGMTKDDLMKLEDKDMIVKKIKEETFKLNQDSKFYQLFTDDEDKEILRNDYLKKGIKQGIEKANIDNARNMKRRNMSYDVIGDITGLDPSFIATL